MLGQAVKISGDPWLGKRVLTYRFLITTPLPPPSQPLWWASQWRPPNPTRAPRSHQELPRSPTCRSVPHSTIVVACSIGTLCSTRRQLDVSDCFFSPPQLLQQLPAERVEQREIPAEHMVLKSTFDSLVQRCQLAAGDPVCLTYTFCSLSQWAPHSYHTSTRDI